MKRRSRRPGSILAAAIAAGGLGLAILFSSCSYLLGDPYGTIGERAVAWTDLAGAVKNATGSGIQSVERMSFLSSGGHSYVFLNLSTVNNTQWLVALDGGTLDLVDHIGSTLSNQSGTNIAVDMDGDFVTSSAFVGLALSPTLAVTAPSPPAGTYCLAADATYNISMIESASNLLTFEGYDATWTASGAAPPISKSLTSADQGWQLSDAATSGGSLLLLFTGSGGAIEVAYPYGASIYAALGAQTYIIDGAPDKSASAGDSSQMAWATSEGLVVGSYANNGLELDLYKLGGSGKTSSYSLATNGSSSVYFEPAGRYFFFFDRSSGRLYKMGTWW
ncbi:MAG: hypothetical protein ACLQMF_01700 [Rectinemataceae bacterium]